MQGGARAASASSRCGQWATTLPRGQTGKVTLAIRYDGPLRAPIAKGERVAELEIRVEGAAPAHVPLAAAATVREANAFERLVNGVRGTVLRWRGRFIAFEGGEGSGKSTQARLLADAPRRARVGGRADPRAGRHPRRRGDPRAAARIRRAKAGAPQAEALLFAAARADHVARRIRPALAAGRWVVCDRFVEFEPRLPGRGGRRGRRDGAGAARRRQRGPAARSDHPAHDRTGRRACPHAVAATAAPSMRSVDAARSITRRWRRPLRVSPAPTPRASQWSTGAARLR